jgi:hypothetical protein
MVGIKIPQFSSTRMNKALRKGSIGFFRDNKEQDVNPCLILVWIIKGTTFVGAYSREG